MGTPLYMSPEQCQGAGVLDHRTDIYSLGVMLYEMLAGRPPFIAEGVGELFAKHMLEEPPPLTDFAPNAPPHMAAAIMKSLAKEPDARFQSMEDFRKALVGEVKVAAPPAPPAACAGCRAAASNTMAQTMSPRASTTLSSASSEIDEPLEARARSRSAEARARAVVGGAARLAVGFFACCRREGAAARAAAVARRRPRQQPAAAAAAAGAAVKKTVTIRFEAEPPARTCSARRTTRTWASCRSRSSSPKDAGRRADALAYVYRLPGYRDLALTADPNTDRTYPRLARQGCRAGDRTAEARQPAPRTTHVERQQAQNPVDEDGLATPVVLDGVRYGPPSVVRRRRSLGVAGAARVVAAVTALVADAPASRGSVRARGRRGCGSRGSAGVPGRRCRPPPRCRRPARRCRRRRSRGPSPRRPRPSSANAIAARSPICVKRSRRISLRVDVERDGGLAPSSALLRQDGLDPAHQRERVALGEIERAHEPRPDPLRALPLHAIAVVPADGHQLVAQEAIDGAPDDVDRRRPRPG